MLSHRSILTSAEKWHLPFFSRRLTLCLCFFFIINRTVYRADFTMTCPPSFIDDDQHRLLCKVDRNTITVTGSSAKCLIVNNVKFELQQPGIWSTLGSSNYPTCNTNFTGEARCVNMTNDVATYELRLTVHNATQYGRALRCWSDCLVTGSKTVTSHYTTCNPITISAAPANVLLHCPPTFLDGEANLVSATVSTTKFPKCNDDPVTRVVFTVIPPVGVSKAICYQTYPYCNTTTNSEGCSCVNKTGSTYTYKLSFIFDKETQTGSSLDLRPSPCISFTYPYPFIHSPCKNLTARDPCSSIPCEQNSTCVNNATDPDGFTCRCPEGFKGRTCNTPTVAMTQSDNSGAIAGGIVGGVLLVAVGVVAVLVIKKKKGTPTNSGRRNDNTPDTGDLTNTSPAITDLEGRKMKLGVSADNSAADPINSSSSSVESSADD